MITPDQIQTVLNYVSQANAPVGNVMRDAHAFNSLANFGKALQAGLVSIEPVKAPVDSDALTK